MSRRLAVAILAVGAALLTSAAPIAASKAVSIDVGTIAVRELLSPGGEYRLPTFGVRNPGTEPTSYAIAVSYIDDQESLRPPAGWFSFNPETLTLGVNESMAVATTLEVPADAEPGEYAALIGPQIVGEGSGPQVGAGAAARLSFTVQPASVLDAFLRQLWRFLMENPWLMVAGAIGLLVILFWFLRRRFSFTVSRRS